MFPSDTNYVSTLYTISLKLNYLRERERERERGGNMKDSREKYLNCSRVCFHPLRIKFPNSNLTTVSLELNFQRERERKKDKKRESQRERETERYAGMVETSVRSVAGYVFVRFALSFHSYNYHVRA